MQKLIAPSCRYRYFNICICQSSNLEMNRFHDMLLTWICQLCAAIKWSTSIKDASRKQKKMLSKLRIRDFRDWMIITIHVRAPTIACVTLSNIARSSSFLPYFTLISPRIEQAPIAHVKITCNQSSRPYIIQISFQEIRRRWSSSLNRVNHKCEFHKDFKSQKTSVITIRHFDCPMCAGQLKQHAQSHTIFESKLEV